MANLNKLIDALQASPAVQQALNTNQLLLFIDLCCHLRQELIYTPGSSPTIPPLRLPDNVQQFLALCLFSSKSSNYLVIIGDSWKALSRIIWATPDRAATPSTLDLFLKHGVELSLCARLIYYKGVIIMLLHQLGGLLDHLSCSAHIPSAPNAAVGSPTARCTKRHYSQGMRVRYLYFPPIFTVMVSVHCVQCLSG